MDNEKSVEYDLGAITENALALSKLSYEAEEQREQSLINQSSQMATAFSFISAVILMLFPIITDTYSEVSLRYLTMLGSTILDSVYTRRRDCDRMEATKRQERKRWMHPITDMT